MRTKEIKAIREEYSTKGVKKFYEDEGDSYQNPHEEEVQYLVKLAVNKGFIVKNVLDLACGSGEVTLALKEVDVTGVDPYTGSAYYKRTHKKAIPLSFKDIAEGKLDKKFDTIICSFALHLCEKSMLPKLLLKLSQLSKRLIVITPHKNPRIDEKYGWALKEEILHERVRLRFYERNY